MGTRAIITKKGQAFIATHWDGYPTVLGKELLKAKTDAEIIKVAEGRTIDFAHESILGIINKDRYKKIADKANKVDTKEKYTPEKIEEMHKKGTHLQFSFMSAGDYPIDDIKRYGDFAEWQYDLRDDGWYFRGLEGEWDGKASGKFKKLNEANIKKSEEEDE